MDVNKIAQGMKLVLDGLGADTKDHNFDKTPERYARALQEMFSPPETDIPVFDEKYADMVIVRDHTFWTLCPHHMFPVKLKASIGYIPNGKVIGASKLMRMMHDVNRLPMTQEALTAAIVARVDELTKHLNHGTIVKIQGQHGCFQIRGVKSHEASMVTLKATKDFDKSDLRREFMELTRG